MKSKETLLSSLYSRIAKTRYYEPHNHNMPKIVQETPGIDVVLNNDGYRSDPFELQSDNPDYLFTGCSFTWGAGLPEKKYWSHFLNNKLGGEKHMNLGASGASSTAIISNIYRYIRQYGKPKAIFALFPNLERFETTQVIRLDGGMQIVQEPYLLHSINFHPQELTQEELDFVNERVVTEDFLLARALNEIKTLEEYLEMLGIPFIWSTWDSDFFENIQSAKGFTNYAEIMTDYRDYIKTHMPEDSLEKTYWFEAGDGPGGHPGVGQNKYFADCFYEAFAEKYSF